MYLTHMPSKVWDEITYPFSNFNGYSSRMDKYFHNCISLFVSIWSLFWHVLFGVRLCSLYCKIQEIQDLCSLYCMSVPNTYLSIRGNKDFVFVLHFAAVATVSLWHHKGNHVIQCCCHSISSIERPESSESCTGQDVLCVHSHAGWISVRYQTIWSASHHIILP